MMQLRRSAAFLLVSVAWAQGPSITDMLANGPSPRSAGQDPDAIGAALGGQDQAPPSSPTAAPGDYPNFGYGENGQNFAGDGGSSHSSSQRQGDFGSSQGGFGQQSHGPPSGDGMASALATAFSGGGQGGSHSSGRRRFVHPRGYHPPKPQGGFGGSHAGPQGGFGGSNGLMGSLLGAVEGNMPGQAGHFGHAAPVSEESREIVSGIVEAFMHKYQLAPGEKQCLEDNLATLTADVVGTGQDVVTAVKAFVPDNGPMPTNPDAAFKNPKTQGKLVSAGMDGAMKISSLATQATSLAKTCIRGDALEMMKAVGRHFVNMSYVGHRMLVSGVDIAEALGDSVIAFESKKYHHFGTDIGTAFRKVILSTNETGTQLPEGIPEESIIQSTTQGLMDGFFTRGAKVEITDSADPSVDIMLDLHQCIAGNGDFFKEIFMGLWHFIAQMAANGEQHGMGGDPFAMTNPDGSQPKWMGELMIAMMQVPMALSRCNIGQSSQQMMMEAIKSIQYLQVHFQFPEYHMHSNQAAAQMARAITAWGHWNFEEFGSELGKLLREFVMLMFPQAYSVDANGRLRRQLDVKASPWTQALRTGHQPLSAASLTFLLSGVALTLVVALVAVRGLRSMSRIAAPQEPFGVDDCAGASDMESANGLLE